jgi:hypothetical protein
MIYCVECRKQIPNGSRFCLRCGKAQPQDRPPEYVKPEDIVDRKAEAFFANTKGSSPRATQSLPPCPDCYGERIWAEYHSYNSSSYGSVEAHVNPIGAKPRMFTGKPKIQSPVANYVAVCTVCGHITFYAQEPQKLIQWRPDAPRNDKE